MSGINDEIKNIETKAESWIKQELKQNWFKILLTIVVCVIVWNVIDDVRAYLKKPNSTIVQTSPAPLNLNANGQTINRPPDVYVNVNPTLTERAVATVTPQTTNSTPSVVVNDPAPKFFLNYNGKRFNYVPYTTEQYNFDPKTWQFNYSRTSEMNVNVEVPTPKYSIGGGMNTKHDPALMGTYRFGRTPFNAWVYASPADQAIGLNFTQYGSSSSKKETDPTKTTTATKTK